MADEDERRRGDIRALVIIGVLFVGALVLAYAPSTIGALRSLTAQPNEVQRASIRTAGTVSAEAIPTLPSP